MKDPGVPEPPGVKMNGILKGKECGKSIITDGFAMELTMKKQSSRFFLKLFLAVFTVYAVYNLVTLQFQINDKESEVTELKASVHTQTLKNKQLEEAAGRELTEEEIVEIARSKLGFSLPGERIFIDITGK